MAEEFGERIGLDNIYDEIIDRISVNPTKERKDGRVVCVSRV